MKRTTVYLPEEIDLELARLARQEERSKAELIREALETFVERKAKTRTLPPSVGMGRSGMSDLAERADEFLAEIYEEKHARIMAEYEEDQPLNRKRTRRFKRGC
ncbi:MAG: CopG family transcriptional regulator [Trueperaceae bacterium]|nr:CopG family transcriptional regulator [Trueperaceae bacterium]